MALRVFEFFSSELAFREAGNFQRQGCKVKLKRESGKWFVEVRDKAEETVSQGA